MPTAKKKLKIKEEVVLVEKEIHNVVHRNVAHALFFYAKDFVLNNKKKAFIVAVVALIVCTAFLSESSRLDVSKNETVAVRVAVERAGKLIVLPNDEVPVIFQISDPETLIAKDPFFIGSQKDDVLLIYQKASKAIIFSPKRNLIINVGPFVQANK